MVFAITVGDGEADTSAMQYPGVEGMAMEVPREHFAGTHRRMSKDLMPNIRNRDQRQRELIAPALTHRQSVVDNVNTSAPERAHLVTLGLRWDS